ncbi:GGDEF domain-containing protein [Pseudomonas xionganensis]|uniref:diguanylate cyclase n=1 Tax=Pseudomonas xionganensis TaxID=2654845 RepID=A0A6I4KPD9_9PSED|nr:GGDEF domain-containing protein [Pseudomonas xionganensis]MVW74185.1 diguanylate cyclase [Pseudomonas xionganensis]
MSDDAQRWKSKYLESLEQQERLEGRWNERLDLLRRSLVRSSLAAEGSDKAVDQCMQELRDILRRDDIDEGLGKLLPRLEKAVLNSEQRRQERSEQSLGGLLQLTEQLLNLDPPQDVRKALKHFIRDIEERAGQPGQLSALLTDLGRLQQQTLSSLASHEAVRPGLLQRLFGGQANAPQTSAAPAPSSQAESDSPLDEQQLTSSPPPSTAPTTPTQASNSPAPSAADPDYALPELPEPGYSAVAEHINASLLGLLDELELPTHHLPQGEALRQRLQGGLNWYELVVVLDDLAVLILAVTDSGQREFASYLKQLNERLASFIGTLSEAHEGYSESIESARSFNQELREQVSGLQASVQTAVDLDSLKQALEARLDGLLDTVSEHQKLRDGREEEVSQRLQALTLKVAEMEQEAQSFRDHLEEQRQKALIDPLTGLANRAGWSERLELEVARWKRYGGELLLAVLDIDHFKRINDDYGHLAGDKVLKIIAGELNKRLRKTDFIARFGGEEFVLLIPSTPLDGGLQLLQTLREGIEQCPFHFRNQRVTITISAGLTAFAPEESPDQVFERADQALYRAKNGGRNRVELG